MKDGPDIGPWLAGLITRHLATLAREFAVLAQARVPLYGAMDLPTLQPLFERFYQVFAEACAAGTTDPLRPYFREIMRQRLAEGVAAPDFIALTELSLQQLRTLLERERAAHPAEVALAVSRLQHLHHNSRLMLSEINLQLLLGAED